MKIQYRLKDTDIIKNFMATWIPEELTRKQSLIASFQGSEEGEPLYLDCDAAELVSCMMALEKEGYTSSIKRIAIGDHFYRSDTGKCPRCYRYRPEIHWNNENLPENCEHAELCDRCADYVRNAS